MKTARCSRYTGGGKEGKPLEKRGERGKCNTKVSRAQEETTSGKGKVQSELGSGSLGDEGSTLRKGGKAGVDVSDRASDRGERRVGGPWRCCPRARGCKPQEASSPRPRRNRWGGSWRFHRTVGCRYRDGQFQFPPQVSMLVEGKRTPSSTLTEKNSSSLPISEATAFPPEGSAERET